MFSGKGSLIRSRVSSPFPTSTAASLPGSVFHQSFVAALDTESRVLQDVLSLRPLSAALAYAPGRAVTVHAAEFFSELTQDSPDHPWIPSHRAVVHLVDVLLSCIDRINRHEETTHDLSDSLRSAAEAAGYAMAHTMILSHVHTLLHHDDAAVDAATILLTSVLASSMEYGHMHPLHIHPLVPSNGVVVFSSSSWPCSTCHRAALVKTDVVYRCAGCDVNLCKECFTRVPVLPSSSSSGLSSPSLPRRHSSATSPPRVLDGLWTHALDTLCAANMHIVALDVARLLRCRVLELPLTAGAPLLPLLTILHDMVVSSASFCHALVHSSQWLPVVITGKAMEMSSFLGPFFRHTSFPDDVVPGDCLCGPAADKSGARATLDAVQSLHAAVVRALCQHGGAVAEATRCWVACTVDANGVRRRLGHSPIECASDGFLINVAAMACQVAKQQVPDEMRVDVTWHMDRPGRLAMGDLARVLPKRGADLSTTKSSTDDRGESLLFYPHYDGHAGVVCDHCQDKDFVGVRYKCIHCDDFDLCSACYDHAVVGLIHEPLRDLPHPPTHMFLRLSIPLPQVTTWSFRKRPAVDLHEAATASCCDGCRGHGGGSSSARSGLYQCSQCDRRACLACVDAEERAAAGNPHRLHAPGHHYVDTTRVPVPPSACRLYQSLYPPQFLPPRADQPDLWWYVAMKSLHVGPVLTLMRYVSVHREHTQLKALNNVETRSRQQSQSSGGGSGGGGGGRRSTRSTHHHHHAATMNATRVDELIKTKSAMEVQLFSPSFLHLVFGYYTRVARWLLHLIAQPDDENDLALAYAMVPETVLCNLADVLYVVGVHPCDGVDWAPKAMEPLVSLLFTLVGAQCLTNSPHVRVQLVRALLSLAPLKSPASTAQSPALVLYDVLALRPTLRRSAVHSLLRFHKDLDHYSNSTGGDSSWGLLPARLSALLLLRWLWNAPCPSSSNEADVDWAGGHHGMGLLFSGALHDITRLLDEATSKVLAMRRIQELQDSPTSTTGAYFQPAMMQSYMALHFNKARTTFRVLIECLELVAWIVAEPSLRAVLCRRSLVDQTASTLSFVVATLETHLHPSKWGFSAEIYQDGMLALAEALLVVVRCAGLHHSCPEASAWKLSNYAGILMEEKIGDLDVHQRWKLSSCLFRLEKDAAAARGMAAAQSIPPPPPPLDRDVGSDNEPDEESADRALAALEAKAGEDRSLEDASRVERQLAARFVSALAADGRFESVRFRRAAVLLRSDPSLTSVWREKFLQVVDHTEQVMALHEQMDARLGAVPDEYLDPILNTLMLHPVQLPSGHIVDRSMIERHLLSASVNPFSREPLTVEMLRPCPELQHTIARFVRSKLRQDNSIGMMADQEAWGLGWECLFEGTSLPND